MREIKTIVVTGGPCAGKTTTIFDVLSKKYKGTIVFVPEAAHTLLTTTFKDKPKAISHEWYDSLRDAIVELQPKLEAEYLERAKKAGAKVIVFDRAILDEAAYTEGGRAEFLKIYKLNLDDILRKYDAVIHLQTLASLDKELYNKYVNKVTLETADEAIEIDNKIKEAWSVHPNYIYIAQSNDENAMQNEVEKIIKEYLK